MNKTLFSFLSHLGYKGFFFNSWKFWFDTWYICLFGHLEQLLVFFSNNWEPAFAALAVVFKFATCGDRLRPFLSFIVSQDVIRFLSSWRLNVKEKNPFSWSFTHLRNRDSAMSSGLASLKPHSGGYRDWDSSHGGSAQRNDVGSLSLGPTTCRRAQKGPVKCGLGGSRRRLARHDPGHRTWLLGHLCFIYLQMLNQFRINVRNSDELGG